MTPQRTIDLIKIIGHLMKYGSEIVVTTSMLTDAIKCDCARISAAIEYGMSEGYLFKKAGAIRVTKDGRTFYRGALRRPHLQTDYYGFKREVLTGTREIQGKCGKVLVQSKIRKAALPKALEEHNQTIYDPELATITKQENRIFIKRLARELEITIKNLIKLMGENRVKICNNNGRQHWGIFDRRGGGHQSKCRRCRKEERIKGTRNEN